MKQRERKNDAVTTSKYYTMGLVAKTVEDTSMLCKRPTEHTKIEAQWCCMALQFRRVKKIAVYMQYYAHTLRSNGTYDKEIMVSRGK